MQTYEISSPNYSAASRGGFTFTSLLHLPIQYPDRIQNTKHGHAGVGKHGQPHIGINSRNAQHHNHRLNGQREHHILVGNQAGALCDFDGVRDRIHIGIHSLSGKERTACV